MNTKLLCKNAIIAALYVALTLINPLSFGALQLRLSAGISVLPFFKEDIRGGVIVGVAIANLFSPLGFADVLVGVIIGAIAYYTFIYIKNVYIDCLLYSITAAAFVGAELYYIVHAPFLMSFFSVFLSLVLVMEITAFILKKIDINKYI